MNLEFDIKSFNFITWHWKNDFNLEDAKREIDYQILNCNINAVTFAFAAQQDHCYSTTIDWTGSHMPNDNQLEDLIKYSKDKGLKTLVKPMLNVSDGYWRAYIRFFDEDVPCEPKWEEWFKSYGEYIIHYAQFCQKNNVDILIIGCELVGTDHRCDEWKSLVKNIRRIYNGALTYNCDKYQEHNVKWWDALDYISSSGYYPVGTISKELDRIEEVCKKNNIKHAYVTCFGSFKKCGYMYLVPKEDAKVGAGYGNVLQKDGPVEFLNGTGVVCQNNNAYDTHFHATMCDASGNVFGGHIVKGYTPTLTTVDLIIFEIKDIEMLRVYDEETDLTQFLPE